MRASRSNLLNSELRVCIPVSLSEMVDVAAGQNATTRSAWVRQAVVDRLKADGLDHAATRQAVSR